MKKFFVLIASSLLIFALLFTVACGKTPPIECGPAETSATKTEQPPTEGSTPPEPADCPDDIMPSTVSFSATDERDVCITVTVDGYQSEKLGKTFFLRHDAPITLRVTVENRGEKDIYKYLTSGCREFGEPSPSNPFRHNHEVDYTLRDQAGNPIVRVVPYPLCSAILDYMALPAGESETYDFTFAAGTLDSDFLGLTAVGETDMMKVFSDNVTPYGRDIFSSDNGVLSDVFAGDFTFSYMSVYDAAAPARYNDIRISVNVELEVLCFGA